MIIFLASEYGIANLKKVGENLIEWTTTDNENYDDLKELYGEFLGVWNRYVNHVVYEYWWCTPNTQDK